MPLDWKTPDMAQVGESYSDILSASRLNQVPKAIDAIIKTVNDLQPNTTGDVTRFVYWTGEIVAKGPDGDADYTDSRYWVKMLAAKAYSGTGGASGTGRNAKVDFQDEKTPGVGGIFTVTSIKEVKAQTHTLAIGQRVEVFLAWNSKTVPYLFMSESPAGFFSVIVKSNGGSDGSSSAYATWAYDLYGLWDATYTKKLNTSGAIQPTRSAARVMKCSVTKATDGSVAVAYYDASGVIKLWDCQELNLQTNCS